MHIQFAPTRQNVVSPVLLHLHLIKICSESLQSNFDQGISGAYEGKRVCGRDLWQCCYK